MSKKYFIELLSGQRSGFFSALLLFVLRLISFLFAAAVYARNFLYDKKIIKPVRIAAKIISVGNISTGGTGKTQIVKYLAELFQKRGVVTAVICRSYSGEKSELWVSRNGKIFDNISVKEAGDEPYMLAKALEGVSVGSARKRERLAAGLPGAELFIMDDAFQYRKVARDADIVLLEAAMNYENIHLMPGGFFREAFSSIRRADIVILTKSASASADKIDMLAKKILEQKRDIEVIICEEKPGRLKRLDGSAEAKISDFKGKTGCVLAALGSPRHFVKMLEDNGIVLEEKFLYPDHYFYKDSDLEKIKKFKLCFVTPKDSVKIPLRIANSISSEIWVVEPDIVLLDINREIIKWPKKIERLF